MRILVGEQGVTLIEVLVATVLLTLILVPLVGTFTTSALITGEAKRISIATALAQQEMERLLAGVEGSVPRKIEGFEIRVNMTDNQNGTKTILVTVSWESRGSVKTIQLTCLRKR